MESKLKLLLNLKFDKLWLHKRITLFLGNMY